MKRIIICCDGTWNKPDNRDDQTLVYTNVEKMYKIIKPKDDNGNEQLAFYHPGVGTKGSKIAQIIGGATGAGLNDDIKDAYTFLICNYNIGDEIYLFGFSRGAYTARSLAGFIRNCGILKPQYLHLINNAFYLYRDRNKHTEPTSAMMQGFKKNYAVEMTTPIFFMGIWDTVGALGFPSILLIDNEKMKYKFHDTNLSSTIINAYHAIAVDEKRNIFKPTYWRASKNEKNQKMVQCLFIGAHSNVGGGYQNSELSDIPLKWMIDKVMSLGLAIDINKIRINPNYKGTIRNSHNESFYKLLPYTDRKIHNADIYHTKIHQSVLDRMDDPTLGKNYKPKFILRILDFLKLEKITLESKTEK